jgi:hypothetical protein
MGTTYTGVRDDCAAVFTTAHEASSEAIVGYEPAIKYAWLDRDKRGSEGSDKAFVRLTITHNGGQHGAIGRKLFDRYGIVWVQVYMPFTDGLAADKAIRLGAVYQAAYESANTPEVTFKNIGVRDLGNSEGKWWRVDVVMDFEWNEQR